LTVGPTEALSMNEAALQHAEEVSSGERFEFGRNWASFLAVLDDERISQAERSLQTMLEAYNLEGKRFLDIGSGSGLFSLAARRLGAAVHSFDYDPQSVACTKELRARYFPSDPGWAVEHGSVLDTEFLSRLGRFDIVYSWGVLHHTGRMWDAIANAAEMVEPGGKLFIAIYNDMGSQSARWAKIKAAYCRMPTLLRKPFALAVSLPEELKRLVRSVLRGRPFDYFRYWKGYRNARGMDHWHDIIDWVGGYPYEYAGPSAIFDLLKTRGFRLSAMRCDNVGLGCNEMVFVREPAA
jgi:2-polyprenyl-3-methyl-5-hydroxy-6-metoxy-1,4-benzoquinol methylase